MWFAQLVEMVRNERGCSDWCFGDGGATVCTCSLVTGVMPLIILKWRSI